MTRTVVESATKTVTIGFDEPFCVIGERINPTGRKKLAAELEAGDFSTVEKDALEQVACGATMLDINAGVVYNSNPNPNETEPPLMTKIIELVQGLTDTPLCIDSSVPAALEELGLMGAERAGDADAPGVIVRSGAEGAPEEAIEDDVRALAALHAAALSAPRDEIGEVVAAPLAEVQAWRDWTDPYPDEAIHGGPDMFEHFGVWDAIEALRSPRVDLGEGGAWMAVEPTSALVAVDVNTGADTSPAAGLKANMATAKLLPRALRVRGLGGQIVVDLAPMPKKDRRAFESALRAVFRRDTIDTTLVGWTPLGHYELQRKNARVALSEVLK